MNLNSVSNNSSTVSTAAANAKAANNAGNTQPAAEKNDIAAIYEKSTEDKQEKTSAKLTKSNVADPKEVERLIKEKEAASAKIIEMLSGLVPKQASKQAVANKDKANGSSFSFSLPTENIKDYISSLEVDEETRLKAQEEISEDGYFGVKKTSQRILDFAKAVAGNDPDKIEEMRKAVEKGFEQAERMWGDELPQICQDTHAAVNEGFDSWLAGINGTVAE